MEALTIPIFVIFLFFATGQSEPSNRRFIAGGFIRPPVKLYSRRNTDIDSSCLCFNKPRQPVTETFSESGINLKRLVFYVYKDVKSNTMKVFTPNQENQDQFPDLGLEDGDLHGVGTETVDQIFNANFNAVSKTEITSNAIVKTEGQNTVIAKPVSQNKNSAVAIVKSVSIDENVVSVKPGSKGENLVIAKPVSKEQYNNVQNDLLDINGDGITSDAISSYFSNNQNIDLTQIFEQQSNFAFTNNKKTSQQEDSLAHERYSIVQLPLIGLQSNSNQLSSDSEIEISSQAFAKPSGQQISVSKDINIIKSTGQLIPKAVAVSGSKNSLTIDASSDSEFGSKSQLLTIPVDSILDGGEDNRPVKSSVIVASSQEQSSLGYDYLTFDKWFDEQMQKIQKIGKSPNKNIDLSSLKHLIEKTLYENGLYVTKDGVLTDSKANALNVTNLKLRPFLIGDSVEYSNIFSANKGDKYELPSNLPYLESVLVTLVDPPKILGVVPLGKTFVPRMSYRNGLDYWTLKTRNSLRKCQTTQCRIDQLKKYFKTSAGSKNLKAPIAVASKTQSGKRNPPHYNDNVSNRPTVKAQKSPKVTKNNKLKQRMEKHMDHNYQYRFNLDKVLQALQAALFDIPGKKNNRKAGATKDKPDSKPFNLEDLFEDSSEEEENEEELPGFRIIGGLPATSSGTPVSSKGRSGHYY